MFAAAAIVSFPGTASADAFGPGAGFPNGIFNNQVAQYAGADIINLIDPDDDALGVSSSWAPFLLMNMTYTPLERISQQGAEYPPTLLAGTRAVITPSAPSTADYRTFDGSGRVHIDATKNNSPTCSGEGSLRCRAEYTRTGVDLVITPS